jgi:Protein of unknown function (DUF3082)
MTCVSRCGAAARPRCLPVLSAIAIAATRQHMHSVTLLCGPGCLMPSAPVNAQPLLSRLPHPALQGLAYLLTFIFGANAVGLSALAVQLLLFPESADQVPAIPKAADPAALPKIKLTDNLYDIRAAFEEVQRQVGNLVVAAAASLSAR